MRRVSNPTRKISITLKDSTFNRLNHYLSYEQSRSAYIDAAIVKKLSEFDAIDISEYSAQELVEALQYKFHVDSAQYALIQTLLQLLER